MEYVWNETKDKTLLYAFSDRTTKTTARQSITFDNDMATAKQYGFTLKRKLKTGFAIFMLHGKEQR